MDGTTHCRLGPPTVTDQENTTIDLLINQSDGDIFSMKFLFPDDPGLYQADKMKQDKTKQKIRNDEQEPHQN